MNQIKQLLIIFLGILSISSSPLFSQTTQDTISVSTPFAKGRWITGIAGSISSGSNTLNTSGEGMNINQYAIDYRTGKFARDRLLVGGLFSLSRDNIESVNSRTLETLYAGPMVAWYLSDDDQGSLFINAAGVFSKFRDETHLENEIGTEQIRDGLGGGMMLRLGYSFVLHKRITFDLSLNYSKMWLVSNETEQEISSVYTDDFTVTDLSFSFGFNIILDHFFF